MVVTVNENVSSEAGRAEVCRLLAAVGARIGEGADTGTIANGNPIRSKADWQTAETK